MIEIRKHILLTVFVLLSYSSCFVKIPDKVEIKISPSPVFNSPTLSTTSSPITQQNSSNKVINVKIIPSESKSYSSWRFDYDLSIGAFKPNVKVKVIGTVTKTDGSQNNNVIWKSLNPEILNITNDGLIYSHSLGTTIIKAISSEDNNIESKITI
ncbi:MAG: hypothetical protein H7263_16465 [Candidatus Sericytochromatia bacterium]|nr:hypothetical protein [Candidatus Sericytochromatia bacterium]